jgi:hypothetical protein
MRETYMQQLRAMGLKRMMFCWVTTEVVDSELASSVEGHPMTAR